MPPEDYDASELAGSPGSTPRTSTNTPWSRRPSSRGSQGSRRQTLTANLMQTARKAQRRAMTAFERLALWQQITLGIAGIVAFVLGVLVLVYHVQILKFLAGFAKKWRDTPAGWLILWTLIVVVSFPPLIGYSELLTIAGMVYGFPNGWFIAASATILGSTASFLVFRTLMRGYAERLVARDKRFAALTLTLKHDGLKLLIMIRLCPLPYSFSNGALATVPTVHWMSFMLATAVASFRLMLHIFVGSKLGQIGEEGEDMDTKTKVLSYLSIAIGVLVGIATGLIMYHQTKKRSAELQAQEREAARGPRRDTVARQYSDDVDALEAAATLREDDDDISLHPAYDDYDDDAYRDDFEDDGAPLASPEHFSTGGRDEEEGGGKNTT